MRGAGGAPPLSSVAELHNNNKILWGCAAAAATPNGRNGPDEWPARSRTHSAASTRHDIYTRRRCMQIPILAPYARWRLKTESIFRRAPPASSRRRPRASVGRRSPATKAGRRWRRGRLRVAGRGAATTTTTTTLHEPAGGSPHLARALSLNDPKLMVTS
jgi:hypothetical protein